MSNQILLFKSHYSLLSSLLTLEEKEKEINKNAPISIFSILEKYKINKFLLCDDNMSGFYQAYQKSKKYNYQLIFGLELNIISSFNNKNLDSSSKIQIWIKNSKGYEDLLKINNFAVSNHINTTPVIDWYNLNEFWTDNLILTIPFYSGFLSQNSLYLNKNINPIFDRIRPILTIANHSLPQDQRLAKMVTDYAKACDYKILNVHYCNYYSNGDSEALLVLKCLKERSKYEKPELAGFSSDQFSFQSYIEKYGKNFEHGFLKIFEEYNLPQLTNGVRLPEITISDEQKKDVGLDKKCSNFEYFDKILRIRLDEQFKDYKNYNVYFDRLELEINTFKKLNLYNYMLLVGDVITYAKSNSITVSPGRGSSAGSLVAYLLGIVSIDPIKHNLYFSRFISEARVKAVEKDGYIYLEGVPPDIDSDFSYHDRHKVFEYIENKYQGKTLKIGTSSTLTGKILIKEVSKIYLNYSEVDAKHIADHIERIFGNVVSLETAYSDVKTFQKWVDENRKCFDLAKKLEGLIRNRGTHASGVAVSYCSIDKLIPKIISGEDGDFSTAYDMKDIANILIKLDVLGLKTLSVVEDAAKLAGIDWRQIDIEDKEIYNYLSNNNNYCGLFQIEKGLGKNTVLRVKPQNIEELTACLSLGRPGAMKFIDNYLSYKDNSSNQDIYGAIGKFLKVTNNVLIFQEQIMEIAQFVYGLSAVDANEIRICVGKKDKEKMAVWEPVLYKRGEELNIPNDVTEWFWKVCNDSADYLFCRCLSPDTIVETISGDYKIMQDIQIGEKIKFFDVSKEEDNYTEVVNIYHRDSVEMYEVTLEDGRVIKCSMEHKFLCEDGGMHSLEDIILNKLKIITD